MVQLVDGATRAGWIRAGWMRAGYIRAGSMRAGWMRAGWRVVGIGGVFALGAACAGERGSDRRTLSVDTVAGVVHVRHSGDAATWRLRELATIGADDGPASFGRVRSVVADADGTIYVADAQASEIRVFGPDGVYLRTIGRAGAGPGEFSDLYSLAWLGDTLAALDPRAGRISLLTGTGEWIRQIGHPPITGPDIRLHSVGRDVYSFDVAPGPDGKPVRKYLRYVAGRVDTLPYPEQQPNGVRSTIVCPHPGGGEISFFTNRYLPRAVEAPAPGGRVAVASSGSYRIALLGETRDTALVIEKQYTPVPISDAEWEDVVAPQREWAAKNPGAKCDPVEFTRPSAKPALRSIFFDDADRMWVELTTAAGHSFDVFDLEGGHLGTMPSPGRQANVPPYVRGDRFYLVAADSLDVQSITVYAIER